MKKSIVAFTPADNNNLKYYEMMKASLRKFHTEEELPLILIDEKKVQSYNDQMFFYRATPIVAKELLQEYETVVKIDADYLFFDKITDALQGDFDVAVCNNSNPRDYKIFPYQFLNVSPFSYVNNGFVIIKSVEMVNFWYDLCQSPLYQGWQMKEQDALNFLVHSNHYKVKRLDEGDSYWGLASKGFEPEIVLKDGKPFLPKGSPPDNWPDVDKWIKAYHFAGGNDPSKGNYRIKFQPEMIEYIDKLVKP